MAYDETLDRRIRQIVGTWPNMQSKKMFGGVCHLQNGNMIGGVHKDHIILRLGPEAAEAALQQPHVHPFDITGRPMKGWVMVAPAGMADDKHLKQWLKQARIFVDTLPAK